MATKYTDSEIEEAFKFLKKIGESGNCPFHAIYQFTQGIENRLKETAEVTQETFEKFGCTWIKHVPGNPQPIADDVKVYVVLSCGEEEYSLDPRSAKYWDWSNHDSGDNIIGYRISTP